MFKLEINVNRSGKDSHAGGSATPPGIIDPVSDAHEEFPGYVVFLDNRGGLVPEEEIIAGSHSAPVYAAFVTAAGTSSVQEMTIPVYRVELIGLVRAISRDFVMPSGKTGITIKYSRVMQPGCTGVFSGRYHLDTWSTISAQRLIDAGEATVALFRPAYDKTEGFEQRIISWEASFSAEGEGATSVGSLTFTETPSSGPRTTQQIVAVRAAYGDQTAGTYRFLDPDLHGMAAGKSLGTVISNFAFPCAIRKTGAVLWWICWIMSEGAMLLSFINQEDNSVELMSLSDAAPIVLSSATNS